MSFPNGKYNFSVVYGRLQFNRFLGGSARGFDPYWYSTKSNRGLNRGHLDYPEAFRVERNFPPTYQSWTVALWLIVSVYCLLWLAAMLIRSRMHRKASAIAVEPMERES